MPDARYTYGHRRDDIEALLYAFTRRGFANFTNARAEARTESPDLRGYTTPHGRRRHVPTAGMLRELARIRDGRPALDETLSHDTCRRRGLIGLDGRLTDAGRAALAADQRRSAAHG